MCWGIGSQVAEQILCGVGFTDKMAATTLKELIDCA